MLTSRTKLVLITTALCILATSVLLAAIPFTSVPDSSLLAHARLVLAPLIPGLHIVAAILFIRGLKGFKPELYKPYRLIAIGIILIGFSMLQSPIVTFFDLWDSSMMRYGYITLPYILAVVVMYLGLRGLHRIIDVKSIWNSPLLMAGGVFGGLIIVWFLPHAATRSPEMVVDIRNAFFALTAFLAAIDALSALALRRALAPAYARVHTWLAAGLFMQGTLVFTSIFFTLFNLEPKSVADLQDFLTLTPVPFIVAGVYFYGLTADTRIQNSTVKASVIDVVLYTASLASNDKAIDPILDDMRLITARMEPGEQLSDESKVTLANTYLKLEHYLSTSEPLRSFNPIELRTSIYRRFFHNNTSDQIFWDKLPLQQSTPTPTPVAPPQLQQNAA